MVNGKWWIQFLGARSRERHLERWRREGDFVTREKWEEVFVSMPIDA